MRLTLPALLVLVFLLHTRLARAVAPQAPATPRPPRISKLPSADVRVLHITAVDSNGREPDEFLVLAGVEAGSVSAEFEKRTGRTVVNWQPHTLRIGKGGQLVWPLDRAYDRMYLRLEADGFQPQIAGPIKKADGPQLVEFHLEADRQVGGQILTPERRPAAGAKVALALAQKDVVLIEGKLRGEDAPVPEKPSDRWRRPLVVKTDKEGRFKLPTEPGPAAILVLHESGVKELSYDDFCKSPQVVLDRWGRVDGRVLWKNTPGARSEVTLSVHRDQYGYPGMIASTAETQTDKNGRFAFERALPGITQISLPMKATDSTYNGATAVILPTQFVHVDVKAGGATRVLIGGQGRVVRGRLTGCQSWKGVTIRIHPTAPHVGFPGDDAAWKAFEELKNGPAGPLLFRDKHPVNDDGTFEISDMLPGNYQLFVSVPDIDKYAAYVAVSVDAESPYEKPRAHDLGEIKIESPFSEINTR